MAFNLEALQKMAPDTYTWRRAVGLAEPRRWVVAAVHNNVAWGETRGGGDVPYQTVVDLQSLRSKCSCLTRKRPCKHLLALGLLSLQEAGLSDKQPMPDWVSDWLLAEEKRLALRNQPKTTEQLVKLAETQAKTREDRLLIMREGISDLQRRLLDLVRLGVGALEATPPQYWLDFSARMVDAKLGALGRRIKKWATFKAQYPEDWHEKLLREMGQLLVLSRAFENFDALSDVLQEELLAQAGVSVKKETLLAQTGVSDNWVVLAQIEKNEDDGLRSRRVWLWGEHTAQAVLLLDFVFGSAAFDTTWVNGGIYAAQAVFYPSAWPQRVLLQQPQWVEKKIDFVAMPGFDSLLEAYAQALAQNPWLAHFPALVADVTPVWAQNKLILVDNTGKCVDTEGGASPWSILALSGGQPITVFGDWTGRSWHILALIAEGRLVHL